MSDLRDAILTSDTARRFVNHVSPIYENSYVGLWIHEAIAREFDAAWVLVRSFPDQEFPETVTWAIELWERRYGIAPDPAKTIEERRNAVVLKRAVPRPFNPEALKTLLFNATGRLSEYTEHIGPYTFGIALNNTDGARPVNYGSLLALIRKHKAAHRSFTFHFQSEVTARIAAETEYWRFDYGYAGNFDAGTKPANISTSVTAESVMELDPGEGAFIFNSPMSGVYYADGYRI